MNMRFLIPFMVSIFLIISCSTGTGSSADDPSSEVDETFDAEDRPELIHDTVEDFELLMPWNYDKDWNKNRKYPLVITLHGSGGSHYKPCIYGNDDEMQQNPCFLFAPTAGGWGGSNDSWVRDRIAALITDYRIDTNRIYLIGYSMGGSGSYPFAAKCYSEHGITVAAIVRLAGQSQSSLDQAIRDSCAVWYHIGLTDTETRVQIARDTYENIKNYFADAVTESVENDEIDEKPRTTHTLMREGLPFFRKSEYTGVGHSASVPFRDPAVLAWMFRQTLKNW